MTGILLINMGGATSRKEMKVFLSRMFRDAYILPVDKLDRYLLSFIISNLRYKKSWKKYELIGGTPIISATQKTMNALQNELPDTFLVKMAFSYTTPLISESLISFYNAGIKEVTVIPLYPQASYSTTSSAISDSNKVLSYLPGLKLHFIKEFYSHEGFIKFWAKNIHDHIVVNNYERPYLVFSAHSIPKYLLKKGDTYPSAIEESSRLIAQKLDLDYEYAYQSGMKKGDWVGPDVKDRLKVLASAGKSEIVLIPISFVNENLETLYDMDMDIIPFGKNELGIKKISRVRIAEADPLFIQLLTDIIRN